MSTVFAWSGVCLYCCFLLTFSFPLFPVPCSCRSSLPLSLYPSPPPPRSLCSRSVDSLTMASDEVNYLILEFVSVALLLFLFGHCFYRGINYTLQIFCIVAILNNINETVLLLVYGNHVMTRAGGSPGCIISAVFEQFLPLSITCLATCMGFHIWFVIVRRSKYTEKELLKWYCLFSFGVPAFTTSIACILLRDWKDLSSYPRNYYCDLRKTDITLGTFAIPVLIVALPGIMCASTDALTLVLISTVLFLHTNKPNLLFFLLSHPSHVR